MLIGGKICLSVRQSPLRRCFYFRLRTLPYCFVALAVGTLCSLGLLACVLFLGFERIYIKVNVIRACGLRKSSMDTMDARVEEPYEDHQRVVVPTRGEVWPLPMNQTSGPQLLSLDANTFSFRSNGRASTCDIVKKALTRYRNQLIFQGCAAKRYNREVTSGGSNRNTIRKYVAPPESFSGGKLHSLYIKVQGPCEDMPHHQMDESYDLVLSSRSQSMLSSRSVWGILRGLESFSQLVYQYDDVQFVVNETVIHDKPRFPHRGLLIDTSRHYLPLGVILDTLDAMAFNKMNVLHWHIVDDQSFPYVSKAFPELSEKGAFHPITHVYTPADVKKIIDEAASRGIRVMVEFDTPGHTRSWGKAFPELLTECYYGDKPTGQLGPMDPSQNTTFALLATLFAEVASVFPDQYIHLGGDEVDLDCWMSNPEIRTLLREISRRAGFGHTGKTSAKAISSAEVRKILRGRGRKAVFVHPGKIYATRLFRAIKNLRKTYVMWQEVFDNHITMPKDAVVQVWKQPQEIELEAVTAAGMRALLSACWYLDYIGYGRDWKKYYSCDPHSFSGNATQKSLVLGGEACIWGEYVDSTNLISRTWPRASAVAERLWSPVWANSTERAEARFEENRCRMKRRGLEVQPQNGPGFCKCDYIA
ncbi:beta-hexosaminidase subunit alpha-like [Haemaphysalis longicornis]